MTRPNSKGYQVLEAFAAAGKTGITRPAAAEAAGCTVQRVSEVLADNPDLVVLVEGENKGLYTIPAPAWKEFKAKTVAAAKAKEQAAADKEAKAVAERAAKAEAKAAAKAAAAAEKANPEA